jgi:GH25 family lysozyme M1 (1,4-beta-N-acetylmuramidase)
MVQALRVDGVDISHFQSRPLGFVAAKRAGVRWVYHKATEGVGSDLDDAFYIRRRAKAKSVGLLFGAYHMAHPDGTDAVAEANHFLSVAKPVPGDMRPQLDLEFRGGLNRAELTAWVGEWVAVVKRATKAEPFIYTQFDLDRNFNCALWASRYNDENLPPRVPEPWNTFTIRQFSDGEFGVPKSVAGFGNVDLNTMNGDPERLTRIFTLHVPFSLP